MTRFSAALAALLLLCATPAFAGPPNNGQGISVNGSLNIGNVTAPVNITANSAPPIAVNGAGLFVNGADGAAAKIVINSYAGNPSFIIGRADTTAANPSAVQSGESLGQVVFRGYDSTLYVSSGTLEVKAAQTFTASVAGSIETLSLNPIGSHTVGVVQTIDGYGHALNGIATVPVITACGTSPSTARGTDVGGEVTEGTTATGCTITFANAYAAAPFCVVSLQTQQVAFGYTISTAAITVTNTSATGDKINWVCNGQ